jgi:hypothetical protein
LAYTKIEISKVAAVEIRFYSLFWQLSPHFFLSLAYKGPKLSFSVKKLCLLRTGFGVKTGISRSRSYKSCWRYDSAFDTRLRNIRFFLEHIGRVDVARLLQVSVHQIIDFVTSNAHFFALFSRQKVPRIFLLLTVFFSCSKVLRKVVKYSF